MAVLGPVEVAEGDAKNVFDALKNVTRANKIHMEFSGGAGAAYIKGIDNLYEFDHGAGSGWLYSVNGVFQSASSSLCPVREGDVIEWRYTLDFGADIGAVVAD
jgi:hypothetical protein